MADEAPVFKCKCGCDLTDAEARIGQTAVESRFAPAPRVEISVECPDCETQYFTFVQIDEFVEAE
jgi:hypothetical protein